MIRTVITGIGAVTPLGATFRESWDAASNGTSGIGRLIRAGSSADRARICGAVPAFDPQSYVTIKEAHRIDLFVQYAVASAIMAAEDAGLHGSRGIAPSAAEYLAAGAVVVGSSRGGIGSLEEAARSAALRPRRRTSPYLMPATTIGMAASFTAQKLGITGHCLGISTACTSGTHAVGEACRLLRTGYPGPIFAGGTDAPLTELCIRGYDAAGALARHSDPSASRPFDRTRSGFVLSEGSCILVIEELEAACRRGARIYAEISGYGSSTDAFHQTRPSPQGEARAMRAALGDAGTQPDAVQFISAHGTSTLLGDQAESDCIVEVFGRRAGDIPVSAMKSMTGHMLAASGAFETAAAAMVLCEGSVYPTINLAEQDPQIPLRVMTGRHQTRVETALVNSFGFGGMNAVLVLKATGRDCR